MRKLQKLGEKNMIEQPIIWFYFGSTTCGTDYKVGYRLGDNSSNAIYEEIEK